MVSLPNVRHSRSGRWLNVEPRGKVASSPSSDTGWRLFCPRAPGRGWVLGDAESPPDQMVYVGRRGNLSAPFDPPAHSSADLGREFYALVQKWRAETATQSSLTRVVLHPSYQRIMAMGRPVLPFILHELRQKPDHWMWALTFIVGSDPAKGETTLAGARLAWLRWAEENAVFN